MVSHFKSGDKILVSNGANIMTAIANARKKWGTGYTSTYTPTSEQIVTAGNYNNWITWITDVKGRTKPANTISIPGNVISKTTIITAATFDSLLSSANAIYNHCHSNCHSNCHSDCNCEGRGPD